MKKEISYFEECMQDPKFRKVYERESRKIDISENIARARHERGLTQAQLARKIKTTPSAISRYESGRYDRYSYTLLKKIAKALDMVVRVELVPAPQLFDLGHAARAVKKKVAKKKVARKLMAK